MKQNNRYLLTFKIYFILNALFYVFPCNNGFSQEHLPNIYFQTPDLSDENIMEVVVDLRPIRKSGVRIEPQYFEDKLIIHNYGYGGYGLSLCFGGAQEAIRILQEEKRKNLSIENEKTIAILGSGVIGLSTAYDLLKLGYNVNIYADKFYPDITSYIAAGIWTTPFYRELQIKSQIDLYEKMIRTSEKRFFQSLDPNSPEFKGVYLTNYYLLKGFLHYERLLKFGHKVAASKRYFNGIFDNGLRKKGTLIKLLSFDSKVFMTDLISKVNSLGADIHKRCFKTLEDVLSLKEDIIINCTSLGSKDLFSDHSFRPVRGHMIHFKNPKKINYMAFFDVPEDPLYWISINSWEDRLILGAVMEEGKEEKKIDPNVVEKLLNYARNILSHPKN